MKSGIIIIFFILALAGCKKESTSTTPLAEQADSTVMTTQKNGSFVNGPYGQVSGEAKIYSGTDYKLGLSNFITTNGPDLKVYLSRELQPVNFINLGSLKSVSGNQLYNIPAGAIITDYKYALIYCQQYGHLFGSAELKN